MASDDRLEEGPLTPEEAGAEVDAVELRCRLREVSRRLAELGRERRAIEEVMDALGAEARELSSRRAEVDQIRQRLEAAAREQERQAGELEQAVEALRCELPLLRQRGAELTELAEDRGAELGELEGRLRHFRGEVHASGTALELLHEAVARIEHKCKLGDSRRAPVADPAASREQKR